MKRLTKWIKISSSWPINDTTSSFFHLEERRASKLFGHKSWDFEKSCGFFSWLSIFGFFRGGWGLGLVEFLDLSLRIFSGSTEYFAAIHHRRPAKIEIFPRVTVSRFNKRILIIIETGVRIFQELLLQACSVALGRWPLRGIRILGGNWGFSRDFWESFWDIIEKL